MSETADDGTPSGMEWSLQQFLSNEAFLVNDITVDWNAERLSIAVAQGITDELPIERLTPFPHDGTRYGFDLVDKREETVNNMPATVYEYEIRTLN